MFPRISQQPRNGVRLDRTDRFRRLCVYARQLTIVTLYSTATATLCRSQTINLRLYCSALRLCCACQLHVSTKTSLYDVRAGSMHPSVRLSVCPVLLLWVCCCGPVGREISIVNCLTTKYDDSAAFARRSSRCCAIDRYLLADGPTAANPQRANGTDRRTDGRAAVMYIMRAVPIIISTIVIDWATPTSARSALAKLLLLLLYC